MIFNDCLKHSMHVFDGPLLGLHSIDVAPLQKMLVSLVAAKRTMERLEVTKPKHSC